MVHLAINEILSGARVKNFCINDMEWSEELFDRFMRNIPVSQALLLIGFYEVQKLRRLVSQRIKKNQQMVSEKGEPLTLDPQKIVMDLSSCPHLIKYFNALPVAVKKAVGDLVVGVEELL